MAIQRLGARKLRALARDTGLDLQMAWNWGDPAWVMLRTFDDRHYTLNRRTGELCDETAEGHVSSCPGGSDYDPSEWQRDGAFKAFGVEQHR